MSIRAGTTTAWIFWGGLIAPTKPPPSNLRRRLVRFAGDIVTFPVFSLLEDGIVTFDICRLLTAGSPLSQAEYITSIVSSQMILDGPDGVIDIAPANRLDGRADWLGSLVSQRLGSWQANVFYIRYVLKVVIMTNLGQTINLFGRIEVRALPDN